MKNRDRFTNIEQRSLKNPFTSTAARIQAAYDVWNSQHGHVSLLQISFDMDISYSLLVDFAVMKMQELHPDIQFPDKRQEIIPDNTWQEMARREAELYYDEDLAPSLELFYYIANPNPMPDIIIDAPQDSGLNISDNGQRK